MARFVLRYCDYAQAAKFPACQIDEGPHAAPRQLRIVRRSNRRQIAKAGRPAGIQFGSEPVSSARIGCLGGVFWLEASSLAKRTTSRAS